MKKVVILSLIVLVTIIFLGRHILEMLSNAGPEAPTCKPLAVKRGVISLRISGRGIVKPKNSVTVKTRRAGQVQEILVKQGQQVTKGQRLVKIKPDANFENKLRELRLRLQNARFKVKTAEKKLERQRKLYSEGLVALMTVELTEEAHMQALRQRRVIEESAKAFEKETGRKISDIGADEQSPEPIYSYIVAPISGTIIAVHTHVGETVPTRNSSITDFRDEGLLIIADLNQYLVEYNVSEIDINKIRIGQTAEVRLDSYPDIVFFGSIDMISASARPRITQRYPRQSTEIYYFTVTILLKKTDPILKPGMSCRVSIIFEKKQGILLAPVEAVAKENGQEFVYALLSDSFVRQSVTTGVSDDNFIEITSDIPEGTLLCDCPLMMLEWEELHRMYQKRSIIEKILD